MKTSRLLVSCVVTLSVGVACGGGPPAQDASDVNGDDASDEAPATAETEDAAGSGDIKWKDMNQEQRMEFMGLTILPEMKKVFQAADPEAYADFKCQTCHGADAKEKNFKMPNGLFALEKPDPVTPAMEYDAEVTKFMLEEVVPKMANLMGMEPVKEFGCFNCHETEE